MEEESFTGYCEKKEEGSPDCAKCDAFSPEDIREEMAVPTLGDELASLCFRLFHRDMKERARWRRKFCRHFRKS